MIIKGFLGTSMIDFPSRISSVVFTGGCNFRCPFCHNPELVINLNKTNDIRYEELLILLKKRKSFIDGVSITGGEPLLHTDLIKLLRDIKSLGLKVKIDTNGSFPDLLGILIEENLLDYIAMDIKTSFEKYEIAIGMKINLDLIKKSIDMIMKSEIDYEFRTTIVPGIVVEEDIYYISKHIENSRLYALQEFRAKKTLNPEFENLIPYEKEKLYYFKEIAKKYVKRVVIREE